MLWNQLNYIINTGYTYEYYIQINILFLNDTRNHIHFGVELVIIVIAILWSNVQQYSPNRFFCLIAISIWCVWFLISSFVQGFSDLNFSWSLVFLLFYFPYQCQLFFYSCVLPKFKCICICICQELDEEPALLTEEYIISIVYINKQRLHIIYDISKTMYSYSKTIILNVYLNTLKFIKVEIPNMSWSSSQQEILENRLD